MMPQNNRGKKLRSVEYSPASSHHDDLVLEIVSERDKLKDKYQIFHAHCDETEQAHEVDKHQPRREGQLLVGGENHIPSELETLRKLAPTQEGFDSQADATTPGAYLVRPSDAHEDSTTGHQDETHHSDILVNNNSTAILTATIVDEQYEREKFERQLQELQLSNDVASSQQPVVRAEVIVPKRRRYVIGGVALVLTLLLLTVIISVVATTRLRNRRTPTGSGLIDKVALTMNISNDDVQPFIAPVLNITNDEVEAIVRFVNQITLSNQKNLSYPIKAGPNNATAEEQALEWFILNGEVLPDQNTLNATQRFAMVVLAFALKSPSWKIENGFDECELFDAISCNADPGVVNALEMEYMGLTGSIPNDIALLTHVTMIDFSNNSLAGTVPWDLMMSRMTLLRLLELDTNQFSGSLPSAKPDTWPELE